MPGFQRHSDLNHTRIHGAQQKSRGHDEAFIVMVMRVIHAVAGQAGVQWAAVDANVHDAAAQRFLIPGFQLDWAARLDDESAVTPSHLWVLVSGACLHLGDHHAGMAL